MHALRLEQDGRQKRVERLLSVSCMMCGANIACPDEQDPWTWLKSADVLAFQSEHGAHGNERTVLAHIKHVSSDDDGPLSLLAVSE